MKKEENSKALKKTTKFDKKKLIAVAIAAISFVLIFYIALKSIAKAPVETLTIEDGLDEMTNLISTQWIYDASEEFEAEKFLGKEYEKIEFSNALDEENNRIPAYFLEDRDSLLASELGFIFYDTNENILKVQLPRGKTLKFLHTKASNSEMENLSFINEKNQRIYFIKEKFEKGEANDLQK